MIFGEFYVLSAVRFTYERKRSDWLIIMIIMDDWYNDRRSCYWPVPGTMVDNCNIEQMGGDIPNVGHGGTNEQEVMDSEDMT